MKFRLIFAVFLLFCIPSTVGYAAASPTPVNGRTSERASGDAVDPLEQAAAVVEQDFQEREEFEFEYYKWRVGFSKASWEWNQLTGKIIFALVLGIVIFSMYISAAQFRSDLWLRRYKALTDKPGNNEQPINFEVSAERIAIQSQTIDVIILAASLVFFFLYLEHIYPMHTVRDEDAKFSVGDHPTKVED